MSFLSCTFDRGWGEVDDVIRDLLNLRTIGADWYGGVENTTDPALIGKKPAKDERLQIPTRATPPSPTTESKYQYQRALALTKALTDHISVYSTEQLKQLQAQSVLVYVLSHLAPPT